MERNAGGAGVGTGRLRFLKRLQFRAAKAGSAALLIWPGKVYLGQREPAPAPPPETETFAQAFTVLRRRRTERDGPRPEVEAN